MAGLVQDLTQHWYLYAAMPLIAAIIGYVTKLVAVEMMFRPLEFRGIPPVLGWQGIIPRNAPRMAGIAVDLMINRLLKPQEIVDRIDVDDMQTKLQEPLNQIVDEMTREVMAKFQPSLWEAMPEAARKLMVRNVQRSLPGTLKQLMEQMRRDVDSVIDLRALAYEALLRDKALTVRLIRSAGRDAFRFIVLFGIPSGFALGLIQAVVWAFTHSTWTLPAFGAVTGLVTDWVALQMVFRPIKPRRYLGVVTWQGLFHRKRAQVTEDYCNIIAHEILTSANIAESLLTGPQSAQFVNLVTRQVQQVVDAQSSLAKPFVVLAVGGRNYQELKAHAAARVLERIREQPPEFTSYAETALDLPGLVSSKMDLMTDEEYESLLRPAFKQDEWKLVAVGALLGFLIGELQVHLLFAGF